MKTLNIIKPDDWHVHFREGKFLEKIVPETSKIYQRAIVMPNLLTPITNSKLAINYKKNISEHTVNNPNFEPLITCYLTDKIDIKDLVNAHKQKQIFAVKLYPSGATTNSLKGIQNIETIFPILEELSINKIPLLIHGEVNDKEIDVFDREKVFIEKYLNKIYLNFPDLKITLEHITTKYAVDFVNSCKINLKASITPHHLMINRSHMLEHKIRPHYFCLPILKREEDRKALLTVATNGNTNFFLGTDSAPHFLKDKENACGCAGIFNTLYSIETLIQLFDNENKLKNLENFISKNGCSHYSLKINREKVCYVKFNEPIKFPKYLRIDTNNKVRVFKPPFEVFWKLIKD